MTVGLRHAQVNRQVCAAGKAHLVVKSGVPAPVRFGQPIDAQVSAETAAIERDDVVRKGGEINRARNDICLLYTSPSPRD